MSTTSTSDEIMMRVAAKSSTAELAGAISHAVYDGKKVKLRAIGAGAVNQAVKSIAIAQGYVAQRGPSLATRMGFESVILPDEGERTAMVFHLFCV